MKLALSLLMTLVLGTAPAFAANACYTPEQMNAEQWLRLHSELMVITVTCHQGSEGQNLPALYGRFTQKHLRTLHEAEQTMIGYYRHSSGGNATERLDRLRTVLANEYGKKSADMSASSFCGAYRDKVEQLLDEPVETVASHVRGMAISERSYAPLCRNRKFDRAEKGG